MVNFRFTRATSSGAAGPADDNGTAGGGGGGAAPSPSTRNAAVAAAHINAATSITNNEPSSSSSLLVASGPTSSSTAATATAAASSSSSSVNVGPDIQNSRQRRLGPGSARKAKRKVLKLLESPRRVIMSRRQQGSGQGGSSSGGGGGGGGGIAGGNRHGEEGQRHHVMPPSIPTIGGGGVGGGGTIHNNRQVSPHYSHFRLDGVTTRSMLKAAQEKLAVDLPASGSSSSSPGAASALAPGSRFPSQETTLLASSASSSSAAFGTPTRNGGPRLTMQVLKTPSPSIDILSWLHDEAPQDILPRVLSFAGSRKIALLSRTCKSWRALALSEPVWRTACEDTGKWRPGVDAPIESTWLQHYVDNPLVPTDYDTIEAAFHRGPLYTTDGHNARPTVPEHRRSLRVLLQPAKYVLRDALVVHAVGDARVTIETVEPPIRPTFRENNLDEGDGSAKASGMGLSSSNKRSKISTASLRDMLTCRSSSAAASSNGLQDGSDEEDILEDTRSSSMPNLPPSDMDTSFVQSQSSIGGNGKSTSRPPRRAVLVLKSRRHNEPIVRVRQGTVCLNKLDMVHNASGTDIWNGNAAVQVQPPFDDRDNPLTAVPPSIPPTAVLDSVDIMSFSGRGVVNIDGGFATIRNCHIHNCAATGLYVGGPGSVATVERTDVLENGNGNERSRRGIARGHSGVYLEQGVATLRDCNISNNSLTGISAISTENATLDIQDSDLVSNGSIQLEMPPAGSVSRRRSVARNNRVSTMGLGRTRSGLVLPPEPERDENEVASPSQNDLHRADRPQSPLADASPPMAHFPY